MTLEVPEEELPLSLGRNVDFLRRLSKLSGLRLPRLDGSVGLPSPLVEIADFGSNPGNLRMFSYVPPALQQPCALVVVLHGCGQTAAAYDLGAGWSMLAKQFGFVLLMPEQRRTNNANACFNWFNPEDSARGGGEACSIRQMIAHMVAAHDIDAHRISITGLSAGGAMTSVMLAAYPEVFAAGAIIAGLPYGVASNLRQALDSMFHASERRAGELGDLVRKASDYHGPWPKISVWHGSADTVVDPGNSREIVKQWLDLHDLPQAPMAETLVDGYPRQSWWDADGDTMVESYTITGMAHGTPLGLADNDQHYGMEGAFLLEAGISSSYHIAQFFKLTDWVRNAEPASTAAEVATPNPQPTLSPAPHLARSILKAEADQPAALTQKSKLDLRAVIRRALTATGLMK